MKVGWYLNGGHTRAFGITQRRLLSVHFGMRKRLFQNTYGGMPFLVSPHNRLQGGTALFKREYTTLGEVEARGTPAIESKGKEGEDKTDMTDSDLSRAFDRYIQLLNKSNDYKGMIDAYHKFKAMGKKPSYTSVFNLMKAANINEERFFQNTTRYTLQQRRATHSLVFELWDLLDKTKSMPSPMYFYYWKACKRRKLPHKIKESYRNYKTVHENNISKISEFELDFLLSVAKAENDFDFAHEIEQDLKANSVDREKITTSFVIARVAATRREDVPALLEGFREKDDKNLYSSVWKVCMKYDVPEGIELVYGRVFPETETDIELDEGSAIRMLECIARNNYSEKLAEKIWYRLCIKQNIYSPVANNTLVFVYLNTNNIEKALNFLCSFHQINPAIGSTISRWFVSGGVPISQINTNYVHKDASSVISTAVQILTKRRELGQPLTYIPFRILMRACSLISNLKMAHQIFLLMEKLGLAATREDFHCILEGTQNLGHGRYALQVVEVMKNRGIEIDSLVIKYLVYASTSPVSSAQDCVAAADVCVVNSVVDENTLKLFKRMISFLCMKGEIDAVYKYVHIGETHFRFTRDQLLSSQLMDVIANHLKKRNQMAEEHLKSSLSTETNKTNNINLTPKPKEHAQTPKDHAMIRKKIINFDKNKKNI